MPGRAVLRPAATTDPTGKFLYVGPWGLMPALTVYRTGRRRGLTLLQSTDAGVARSAALAFHPEGRFLYLASPDAARILKFEVGSDGRVLGCVPLHPDLHGATLLTLDSDGRWLAVAGEPGWVAALQVGPEGEVELRDSARLNDRPSRLSFCPKGRCLSVEAGRRHSAQVFDVDGEGRLGKPRCTPSCTPPIRMSPSGEAALSTSRATGANL